MSTEINHDSNQRFVIQNDGTVIDTSTGLMWMRCLDGQIWHGETCRGSANMMTWDEAMAIRRDFAGHSDWRLPTADELKSIVDKTRHDPVFDPLIFFGSGVTSELMFYWTSSIAGSYISAHSGSLGTTSREKEFLDTKHAVRLVRNATTPQPQDSTASGSRFIDNNDGTVRDPRTGLIWMRCAYGENWDGASCTGSAKKIGHGQISNIPMDFAGHKDWRMPNAEELQSILIPTLTSPDVYAVVFRNDPDGFYWTFETGRGVFCGTGGINKTSDGAGGKIRLVRDGGFNLQVGNAGKGDGAVTIDPQQTEYAVGTKVIIKAKPLRGCVFTGWSGDMNGMDLSCLIVMDADKRIVANFEEKNFALRISQKGGGSGRVKHQIENTVGEGESIRDYPVGTCVTLIAIPAEDSVFTGWFDHATGKEIEVGNEVSLSFLLYSDRAISAHFERKTFEIHLIQNGTGKDVVTCSPEGFNHPRGTAVTLIATPDRGSVFSGWSGDASGESMTCDIVMDAAKTVTASFSRLTFGLKVETSGTGFGSVTRSRDADCYGYDDTVTLTASAAEGSIFNGWSGDAAGLDATCTVVMDSAKTVTAEFALLDIPELPVGIAFEATEEASMEDGDDAFICYFSIFNKGQNRIRIELPLSCYTTCHGEEFDQDVWLSELVNGTVGAASISAGAFRKAGLVFYRSKLNEISAGDCIRIAVNQAKPMRGFNFTFRCTDKKSRAFTLIEAVAFDTQASEEEIISSVETADILQRLERVEAALQTMTLKLQALQAVPPVPAQPLVNQDASARTLPRTLSDVLAWLASQERVSVIELRAQLLPIDLLPGALIDEINERALDLAGDVALEEVGDEIFVARDILSQIVATWHGATSM